jgi:hypothetical protein
VVGISPATRHATPDQPMGVPPPPRLWSRAYCRWLCRGHRGRRVPLVGRLRMGSLLPGCWGAELRGWLLVHHYRSLRTSPSLSPRAATSPRLILPTDRRAHHELHRVGGRGLLGCHCGRITYASGRRFAAGASAQAAVEQTIAADEPRVSGTTRPTLSRQPLAHSPGHSS